MRPDSDVMHNSSVLPQQKSTIEFLEAEEDFEWTWEETSTGFYSEYILNKPKKRMQTNFYKSKCLFNS